MKSRLLLVSALLTLVAIAAAVGYLMRRTRAMPESSPAARPSARADADVVSPAATAGPRATPAPDSPLLDGIERVFALLEKRSATAADLAALKSLLLAGDPAKAIAAIRGFLKSGRNAATGQEFAIAPGGGLNGAPTLRLFLLDLLGQVARKNRSDAAAQVAHEILATKDSPDEWALALRNVAWTEPGARTFLADKMREMLAYEPWRAAPSAGMLEAMDVIVFAKDASLIPALAEARDGGNGELAHAAEIALDRLAEAAPLEALSYLNTHPTTLGDRPFMRADYYAKADLSQLAQRAQIEVYLGRPDVSLEEKRKALGGLMTPASFISDSLVTTPAPPDDGTARRAALAQAAGQWLSHDQFPSIRGALIEVQQRLTR